MAMPHTVGLKSHGLKKPKTRVGGVLEDLVVYVISIYIYMGCQICIAWYHRLVFIYSFHHICTDGCILLIRNSCGLKAQCY